MSPSFARKLLSTDVLGPLLVIFAIQMLTYGISSSLLGSDTNSLFLICLIAAAIGWILSATRRKVVSASFVIVLLGLVGIWMMGARLFPPLLDLAQSITVLIPRIVPAIRQKIPLDTSLVQNEWMLVVQSSSALAARWQTWLAGLDASVKVDDVLIRSMIWSFVMWCLGAWTGWFAARRNAMLALLPGIGLLALVVSYSEYRSYTLWVVVILMLLLMGIWNVKNHTILWERQRVDYSESIVYDNTQAIVLLAFFIGALAFSMPSISWQNIRDAIREYNKNQAAEVLGVREQTLPAKQPSFQKPALPREHLLTEGFAQSKQLVMTIQTGELPPAPNTSLPLDAPNHYWRSTMYDKYLGTGWVTSSSIPQRYRANTALIPGLLDDYQPLHIVVDLQQPEGRLFWSGLLYSATVPYRVDWRVRPDSDLFADQTALLQADMFAVATGATSYEAESYIPRVTVEQLRAASPEYPLEIRRRYLQLPDELPARVRTLAKEITSGVDNPYDKAKAIESYLRNNYPYDLQIPAPPPDQDVADYFLFDLKRGYCDYYATAMVVLARASGLPARFVSGYSSGSYDALAARYVVRELNAHSWPEIYFPKIGWIEFEPTASQPEIKRNEKEIEGITVSPPVSPAEKFVFKLKNTGVLDWISPLALMLLAVVLYFTVVERMWMLRRAPENAVAHMYQRYYRLGRPLAGERTRAETASEFTEKLVRKMDQMKSTSKHAKAFRQEAYQLTNVFLLSLFSNHQINQQEIRNTYDAWKQMRHQLLTARLLNSISRWKILNLFSRRGTRAE